MPRLIIYPHGLGDIILLTPALRALQGQGLHVAVLKRFAGTEILDACPYIDAVHYALPDPWNDGCGRNGTKAAGDKLAQQLNLKSVWIWHRPGHHKIHENFRSLGISGNTDYQTTFWLAAWHQDQATAWLNGRHNYGFLHCATGMPGLSTAAVKKDFPSELGREWLLQHGCGDVIEVGVDYDKKALPMPVQFEIMQRAVKVCLADSVFYHACHAMGKSVDFCYFGRGEGVWKRVRPLCGVSQETVSWEYPRTRSSSADPGPAC